MFHATLEANVVKIENERLLRAIGNFNKQKYTNLQRKELWVDQDNENFTKHPYVTIQEITCPEKIVVVGDLHGDLDALNFLYAEIKTKKIIVEKI